MQLKSLLSFGSLLGLALAAVDGVPPPVAAAADSSPNPANEIKATIDTTFPDHDTALGMTVVNGRVTRINIAFTSHEKRPVSIDFVGGAIWDLDHKKLLKNLMAVKVNNKIEPEQKIAIPYSFITDMHAQDVVLELGLVITTAGGKKVPYSAFNGTISVAEPPTSILDPQLLFLYLVLSSIIGGIGYFAYSTWIVPLLPKKEKVRVRREPEVKATKVTGTVPAKSIDESWIPEMHLKKPVAQRVGSGYGSQSKKGGKKVE